MKLILQRIYLVHVIYKAFKFTTRQRSYFQLKPFNHSFIRNFLRFTETFPESCQGFKMEPFAKIVNGFVKRCILHEDTSDKNLANSNIVVLPVWKTLSRDITVTTRMTRATSNTSLDNTE